MEEVKQLRNIQFFGGLIMLEKLEYYICLFLYGLKEKEQVSKNTLFRYVYIFDVVNDYFGEL